MILRVGLIIFILDTVHSADNGMLMVSVSTKLVQCVNVAVAEEQQLIHIAASQHECIAWLGVVERAVKNSRWVVTPCSRAAGTGTHVPLGRLAT